MTGFEKTVERHGVDLSPISVDTMQINITRLCNQACRHCHVDASPRRREMMSDDVIDLCLQFLSNHENIGTLDITGGAPELHGSFTRIVREARALGRHVMVRHNLTVARDPHPVTGETMSYLPEFFAGQGVEVVSSLPFYSSYMTDRQRGKRVFEKSIETMRELNALGYGTNGHVLNLVYNPVGPYLPPDQPSLEAQYRRHLSTEHGVQFNSLFTITNMPIHRFRSDLERNGGYEAYMDKLSAAFNPGAAEGVMCRTMMSVSHDGFVYDCDFNQMLDMKCRARGGEPLAIQNFDMDAFLARRIRFDDHCFGCTAGAGSSCGGATVAAEAST